MTKFRPHPLVLIILDGWGYREEEESNAILAAKKPNWDRFWHDYAHTLISGSGKCVGLPDGQMGNSEVGHLTMGAGRTVYQDLSRIDVAIEDGSFFKNEALVQGLRIAKENGKRVHLLGLVSPGGVHSHENHLYAMLQMAAKEGLHDVFVHAILDGRDTPPRSAMQSLEKLQAECVHTGAKIASIIGRYYAMDRDKRWDRVEKAYQLFAEGKALFHAHSAIDGLRLAYERDENDEFVQATAIHAEQAPAINVEDGDVIIFMNFRADRAREITEAFTQADFAGFKRMHCPRLGAYICLAQYDKKYGLPTAFPPQSLTNMFGDYISRMGLKQLRIAETEKYAHVTFFFNGGVEQASVAEERLLIPSPSVATYDLQPEMSAARLTDELCSAIESGKFDVIICNYANPDMVGHTGNFAATVLAIETIDACLGRIQASLNKVGGEALITADHGNAEQMFDPSTNQPHTAHTSELVPLLYIGRKADISITDGKLSDIAPTLLALLNIPQPSEMTGRNLLSLR